MIESYYVLLLVTMLLGQVGPSVVLEVTYSNIAVLGNSEANRTVQLVNN